MHTETSHAAAGAGRRPASRWALLLALAGCAEMPVGPTVAVMPWQNEPFDVFVQDDALCRSWGSHAVGLLGHEAAARQMLSSVAAGAVIGAVVGGLLGGKGGADPVPRWAPWWAPRPARRRAATRP